MTLVDSSCWIEHFRNGSAALQSLLMEGSVVVHEFVIGELALGHFKKSNRIEILDRLSLLDSVPLSQTTELLDFVLDAKIPGLGLGWVDCHLLHACQKHHLQLLTLDKALAAAAKKLLR